MKEFKLPPNFSKYDGWIQEICRRHSMPWKLAKAQVWQESEFEPMAVSRCGAAGLLQLMPETDFQIDGDLDGTKDPKGNLEDGIHYDKWLYDRFPEIPNEEDRLKFALASFNGGRGYINKAIEIAYDCEFAKPIPPGHKGKPGRWQTWCHASAYLCSPYCTVTDKKGKVLKPDYRQILDYIDLIWEKYEYIQVKTLKVVGS